MPQYKVAALRRGKVIRRDVVEAEAADAALMQAAMWKDCPYDQLECIDTTSGAVLGLGEVR